MGATDDLFGSVLIGSWMAAVLYGLVISQTFQYFKMYPKDTRLRKAIVLFGLFVSSVGLAGEFADVYLYWPAPVYVTFNAFTGAIVNTFLIHRFYTLSKNLWVSLICGVFVLVGRNKAKVSALIWLIATATGGKLVQRLVIGAIQTGSTTSTVAILTLVTFLIDEESNVPTGFHFLIGPLYMLTLLYNFNLRQHDGVSGSHRSTERMGIDMDENNMRMDKIHVHRTAIVTIDTPDTNTPRGVETVNYGEEGMKTDSDVEWLGTKNVRVPDF
ncbi:hypothetical protein B0H13DRAFT_1882701 [Mycena leptocephala]|nr:hypothetical protein B0H13DRAFT_1882701 [Mycena leptocephala]